MLSDTSDLRNEHSFRVNELEPGVATSNGSLQHCLFIFII